jgi:hypothetical protein
MFLINRSVGELFTSSANNKLDGIFSAGMNPAQKGHININKSDIACVASLSGVSLNLVYWPARRNPGTNITPSLDPNIRQARAVPLCDWPVQRSIGRALLPSRAGPRQFRASLFPAPQIGTPPIFKYTYSDLIIVVWPTACRLLSDRIEEGPHGQGPSRNHSGTL